MITYQLILPGFEDYTAEGGLWVHEVGCFGLPVLLWTDTGCYVLEDHV